MGRIARGKVFYDGCFAHVFSRSIEQKWIFKDDLDFERFKDLILEVKVKNQFLVRHYCLMNTHFHLAVTLSSVEKFSAGLQKLKLEYTKWFNVRYKRVGPLWRERFKGLLIEDERYLYACGLYIEQNPVKARIVARAEDWRHSSSGFYFLGKTDSIVDSYDFPNLPQGAGIENEAMFTRGTVIGSRVFRARQQEERDPKALPVP
ncbi:MAG: transposase [Candidatus Omnitrophica bacterium]|nr:transposase [Candidatus Omnitrophota bacterium]